MVPSLRVAPARASAGGHLTLALTLALTLTLTLNPNQVWGSWDFTAVHAGVAREGLPQEASAGPRGLRHESPSLISPHISQRRAAWAAAQTPKRPNPNPNPNPNPDPNPNPNPNPNPMQEAPVGAWAAARISLSRVSAYLHMGIAPPSRRLRRSHRSGRAARRQQKGVGG